MRRYNGKELQMLESKDPANLDMATVMPLLRSTAEEAERDGMQYRAGSVRALIERFKPEAARQFDEAIRKSEEREAQAKRMPSFMRNIMPLLALSQLGNYPKRKN